MRRFLLFLTQKQQKITTCYLFARTTDLSFLLEKLFPKQESHNNPVGTIFVYLPKYSSHQRSSPRLFTVCQNRLFTVPIIQPNKAPSHTMARSSLSITAKIIFSPSSMSSSLMRSRMMRLMSIVESIFGR